MRLPAPTPTPALTRARPTTAERTNAEKTYIFRKPRLSLLLACSLFPSLYISISLCAALSAPRDPGCVFYTEEDVLRASRVLFQDVSYYFPCAARFAVTLGFFVVVDFLPPLPLHILPSSLTFILL